MNKLKKHFSFLFLLTVISFNTTKLQAAAQPEIFSTSSILIDKEEGNLYFQRNIDEQVGFASITKLMTIYVFMEYAKENKIDYSEEYPISGRVAQLKHEAIDASGVWYNPGQMVSIQDLITFSLVYSDNSAVIQLAEIAYKSEGAMVQKMNEIVQSWGLKDTIFYNVSGLTMSDYGKIQIEGTNPTDYNKSTARETAKMIKKILTVHPEIVDYTKEEFIEYKGEKLSSFNLMLPGKNHEYKGVIGLKTGTSIEAKSNFAGLVTLNNKEYISVVLGAEDSDARFNETAKIYDWFKGEVVKELISPNTEFEIKIKGDLSFDNASYPKTSINTIAREDLNVTLENVKYNTEYFDANNRVKKDIKPGETVVTIILRNLNESSEVGTIDSSPGYISLELTTKDTIRYQGKILSFITSIPIFLEKLYNSIM